MVLSFVNIINLILLQDTYVEGAVASESMTLHNYKWWWCGCGSANK